MAREVSINSGPTGKLASTTAYIGLQVCPIVTIEKDKDFPGQAPTTHTTNPSRFEKSFVQGAIFEAHPEHSMIARLERLESYC